jgi:type I restriction enzyme R subunit
MESVDPSTGEVFCTTQKATAEHAQMAIDAALRAKDGWMALPHENRIQKFRDLEDILIELEDQWGELVVELRAFVKEVKAGPPKDDAELDPATEIPFLRILRQALRRQGEASREEMEALAPITLELVDHLRQEVRNLDFWRNSQKQEALRERIINILSGFGIFQLDRVPGVADRVMELARANPPRLVA